MPFGLAVHPLSGRFPAERCICVVGEDPDLVTRSPGEFGRCRGTGDICCLPVAGDGSLEFKATDPSLDLARTPPLIDLCGTARARVEQAPTMPPHIRVD